MEPKFEFDIKATFGSIPKRRMSSVAISVIFANCAALGLAFT